MAQIHPDTETAVANEALSHIREPGLLSIDADAGRKADVVRLHFPSVRDALQRRFAWNFNKRRLVLSNTGKAPAFGYSYQFTLSNNPKILRVREVHGCARGRDWSREGNMLLCNSAGPLNVIASILESNVGLWDAQFRNAFAWSLAAALGEICKDDDVISSCEAKARQALQEATPVDSDESGENGTVECAYDIIAARR